MPGIILTENWTWSGPAQFVGNRSPWVANRTDFVGNGFGAFVVDAAPAADYVAMTYPGSGNYCYTVDATSADHYLAFTPKSEGPAYHALVRFVDSDNFIGITLTGGRVFYRVRANAVDGGLNDWTASAFDPAAVYEVRAEGATLKIFKSGVQLGSTISIAAPAAGARRVGFGMYAASINPFLGPVEVGFLGVAQTGTLSVPNSAGFFQVSPGASTRTVSVPASWTGSPSGIRRRLETSAGVAVPGFDWAVGIASPSGTSGTIVLTSVPAGGPYFLRADFASDAGVSARQATGFHVGQVVLALGQSNIVGMGQTGSPGTAQPGTYLWNSSATAFQAPVGDGQIALLGAMRTALGVPVALVNAAIGATDIASWQPGQPNYTGALAQLTLAGGDAGAIVWGQGEADAANTLVSASSYQSSLGALYAGLQSSLGRTAGQLPMLLAITGRNARALGQAYGNDASWQAVRSAQMTFAITTTGVSIGAQTIDLPMADSIHYSNAGYAELGRRLGRSLAKALGAASVAYDGAGPQLASARRAGAVITVTCDLRGSTALAGTPPLTGWEVSRDGFTSLLTIQSSQLQAPDRVLLTLATPPAANDTVQLRYLFGANPDVASVVVGGAA